MDPQQLKSVEVPMWILAVLGFILLLVGYKIARALLKVVFVLLAVALILGVLWWYLHPQ